MFWHGKDMVRKIFRSLNFITLDDFLELKNLISWFLSNFWMEIWKTWKRKWKVKNLANELIGEKILSTIILIEIFQNWNYFGFWFWYLVFNFSFFFSIAVGRFKIRARDSFNSSIMTKLHFLSKKFGLS